MSNYDGTITYINVNYNDPFYSTNGYFRSLNSNSAKLVTDLMGTDWDVTIPETIKFYFNGVKTIEDPSKVSLLTNKTQNYSILLFTLDSEKVYLNLINNDTFEPLPFCPELKDNFTDVYVMGVVATTPNTTVVVMGYTSRFLAFYTSLFTRQSDMQDFMCLCTAPIYTNNAEKYAIADMNGVFYEELEGNRYVKPIISSASLPFKALMCHIIDGGVDAYVSVGDVLTAIQDTNRRTSKITYEGVDYCKYAIDSTNANILWFRIYGGTNGV